MNKMTRSLANQSNHSIQTAKKAGLTLVALLFVGCMAETAENPDTQPSAQDCSTPAGYTLTDIESATDWINALPKPTSLPCFLESLPRPLNVNFTQSIFSAQPSLGKENPRMFIFFDKLIFSVVPEHNFSRDEPGEPLVDLLEVAYINNDVEALSEFEHILSIKGEYKFPINETIPYSNPYEHLAYADTLSLCGVCHADETRIDEFDGYPVYQSELYRPLNDLAVSISFMIYHNATCDPILQPFRCSMLSSLFDHGELIQTDFPEKARTFE